MSTAVIQLVVFPQKSQLTPLPSPARVQRGVTTDDDGLLHPDSENRPATHQVLPTLLRRNHLLDPEKCTVSSTLHCARVQSAVHYTVHVYSQQYIVHVMNTILCAM